MIITRVKVTKFRGFENQEFFPGNNITIITGKNGTQKTTMLGLISQPFSINKQDKLDGEVPLCGGSYRSGFSEKFRLSPKFDTVKNHEWEMDIIGNESNPYVLESIYRDRSKGTIRFWKKGSREKGDDYMPFPVIYLSLKRLYPVGEDIVNEDKSKELDDHEKRLFREWHIDLLNIQYKLKDPTLISGKHKDSAGVEAEHYDWHMNSIGQDNLSKILLALLSFRRLKLQYPKEYKGGILAIDEVDTTLHSSTLIKLFRILNKCSNEYKIQIFCTTHSLQLIEYVMSIIDKQKETKTATKNIGLIYLQSENNKVKIEPEITFESIKNRINEEINPNNKPAKLKIYTEDNETILFAKAILKTRSHNLEFVKIPFPCTTLIELVSKKVPTFNHRESIIILDGDVRTNTSENDKIKKRKLKNIILLPGNDSPERLLANYLNDLDDGHKLWESINKDYNKSFCFKDHKIEKIKSDREVAKAWFNTQLKVWQSLPKVVNEWMKENKEACEEFITKFEGILKSK